VQRDERLDQRAARARAIGLRVEIAGRELVLQHDARSVLHHVERIVVDRRVLA
jgi:hypothetical protein